MKPLALCPGSCEVGACLYSNPSIIGTNEQVTSKKKTSEVAQPVPIRVFLQLAKTTGHVQLSLLHAFVGSAKPIFKTDCSN